VPDKNHEVCWETLRFTIIGLFGQYRVRMRMSVVALIQTYVCCILIQ